MRVHLRGTMVATRAVLRSMVARGAPGRVIISRHSQEPGPLISLPIQRPKAVIIGFTKALAKGISSGAYRKCHKPWICHADGSSRSRTRSGQLTLPRPPSERSASVEHWASAARAHGVTSELLSQPELNTSNLGPLVVYLASDQAAAITGRVFGANGWRYSRWSEFIEERSVLSLDGWTVDKVASVFSSTLGDALAHSHTASIHGCHRGRIEC